MRVLFQTHKAPVLILLNSTNYRLSTGGVSVVGFSCPDGEVFTVGSFLFFSPLTWRTTQRTAFSIVQKIIRRLPAVFLSITGVAREL